MLRLVHENPPRFDDESTLFHHANLVPLTGDTQGILKLHAEHLALCVEQDNRVFMDTSEEHDNAGAVLRYHGLSYEITAAKAAGLYVNDRETDSAVLETGDIIRLGENGPTLMFENLCHQELFAPQDEYGRANDDRVDGHPQPNAPANFLAPLRGWIWAWALALVLALAGPVILTWQNNTIQKSLSQTRDQINALSRSLERYGSTAVHREDWAAARVGFSDRLRAANDRIRDLETVNAAGKTLITNAMGSVVFLQGAYAFTHPDTGESLRYVTDAATGEPHIHPTGHPVLSLSGHGTVATKFFSGTGFLVAGGKILTNRHIAIPWEDEPFPGIAEMLGLKPTLVKFVGYLPNRDQAFDVSVLGVSDDADIAVLGAGADLSGSVGLQLSDSLPQPGDEVVIMGYPAGLQGLMLRVDRDFRNEIENNADSFDWWDLAGRLAREGYITPLASRGIVAQNNDNIMVYDAETAKGGSGSPVLTLDGKVVAVNSAIVESFGGANMGVPASHVQRLLAGDP